MGVTLELLARMGQLPAISGVIKQTETGVKYIILDEIQPPSE
jgi:hypothetical protein